MRVVLYTDDMEPITVVDLNRSALDILEKERFLRVPVPIPIDLAEILARLRPSFKDMCARIVTITAERLIRNGVSHLMLFTRQDEDALLLKSAFLPGQIKELRDAERDAFAKGFFHAFKLIGQR